MTLTLDRPPTPGPLVLDEPVDDGTRREFLAGGAAIALLGLAACGGEDSVPDGDATRRVRHAAGTTDVPARPSRVVAIGGNAVAIGLIALGLTPVGAQEGIEDELAPVSRQLPPDVDPSAIAAVGEGGYDPSLEAIAAIGPGMILGDDGLEDRFYEPLSRIAPTVLVAYGTNGTWRERFRAMAGAVGRGERGDEVEAAYEQALTELRRPGDATVAFVRKQDGEFRLEGGRAAFPGSVAADAGIPALDPEGVGEFSQDAGFVTVSDERLDVLSGADLIVVGDRGEEPGAVEQFARNPLWERLPAVRNQRVLALPQAIYNGGHHYAATALLGELAGALR